MHFAFELDNILQLWCLMVHHDDTDHRPVTAGLYDHESMTVTSSATHTGWSKNKPPAEL